jgi:hypothetical protein
MEYRDEYIRLHLPIGFSFHSRPNYCTWDFIRDDALISVQVRPMEQLQGIEGVIRRASTPQDPDYDVSGPYEFKTEECAGVYSEWTKKIFGTFHSKQVLFILRHRDFSAHVTINDHSPYDVSEYIPFLNRMRASEKRIEASREAFVREHKRESKQIP